MANLSDEAIKASADQMEAMAANPEMIKMAQQQLAGHVSGSAGRADAHGLGLARPTG